MRKNARLYEYGDQLLSMKDISSLCGIKSGLIISRLRAGWPMSKATTVDVGNNGGKGLSKGGVDRAESIDRKRASEYKMFAICRGRSN